MQYILVFALITPQGLQVPPDMTPKFFATSSQCQETKYLVEKAFEEVSMPNHIIECYRLETEA